MAAKQAADEQSTRHGITFEEAVCEFVAHQAQQAGDIAQATGHTPGRIKNCKVGDCVIELGPDSAAAGTRFVVEAKEKAGYTLTAAREEAERARKNRGAQLCLFVYSAKTAPPQLDSFARYGHDIFVVWNPEQPSTDVFLRAGLATIRALCVRESRRREGQAADFTAIDQAILEIEKRSSKLQEIETWTANISRDAGKIWEQVRKTYEALDRQVDQLRERIADVRSAGEQTD